VETSARAAVMHATWAHGVGGVLVPVMASVVVVPGEFEAGEENGRDDEQDARCFTHAEMMRGQRIGCAGYEL
jgi:hypothetical protein